MIRERDLLVFFRCFHATLGSGLSLLPSLELLSRQTESKKLAEACRAVCRRVNSGQSLSQALRAQQVFSDLQCRLVEVGERTGTLHTVLGRLASYQEQQLAQKLKLRRALETPAWTLLACLLLVTLLPCLLFEGVFAFLRDSQMPIPWPTRLVMNFADCLKSPWIWILGALGCAALVGWARRHGKKRLQALPGIASLLKALCLQRFSYSLALMLEVGLPLLEALRLAAAASGSPALQQAILEVIESIKDGYPLTGSLEAHPDCFPASMVQTMRAGEECGRLPELLNALSRMVELDVETRLQVLTQAAEPIALCLVGSIVGFTVLATMLPLVSLLNGL